MQIIDRDSIGGVLLAVEGNGPTLGDPVALKHRYHPGIQFCCGCPIGVGGSR